MNIDTKSQWYRICPSCRKRIFYNKKRFCLVCSGKICRSCYFKTMKGTGNPHYGKKHSSENIELMRRCKLGKKLSKGVRKKISQSTSGRNHWNYGKHHSESTRRKMRKSVIKKILNKVEDGQQISPSFNPLACEYFDKLNKKRGWNLQHAMNGGEFFIKDLGYWVDGYDKKKNIVVEYDEPRHYDVAGNLKLKDLKRMIEIKNYLNCKFYRYNQQKDELNFL